MRVDHTLWSQAAERESNSLIQHFKEKPHFVYGNCSSVLLSVTGQKHSTLQDHSEVELFTGQVQIALSQKTSAASLRIVYPYVIHSSVELVKPMEGNL